MMLQDAACETNYFVFNVTVKCTCLSMIANYTIRIINTTSSHDELISNLRLCARESAEECSAFCLNVQYICPHLSCSSQTVCK